MYAAKDEVAVVGLSGSVGKIPDGVGMMMTDGGVAAVAVAVADLYCWCSYLVAVMGIRVSSVYDCCCA